MYYLIIKSGKFSAIQKTEKLRKVHEDKTWKATNKKHIYDSKQKQKKYQRKSQFLEYFHMKFVTRNFRLV